MTNEELVNEYQRTGNSDILWTLCEQNKSLVYYVVQRFRGVYSQENERSAAVISSEDLRQDGYIGLILAANNYDDSRGVLFSSVAVSYIHATISRSLRNRGRVVRLPSYSQDELNRLKKARQYLTNYLCREPSRIELKAFLGLTDRKLDNLLKIEIQAKAASLDKTISAASDDSLTLGDMIPGDNPIDAIEENIFSEQRKKAVWAAVDGLEAEQSEIVHRYYGSGETLREIGNAMNISPQRVAQVKDRALQLLRRGKNRKVLEEFASEYSRADTIARGGGLSSFKRTGTSSTELAAIIRAEAAERARRELLERAAFNLDRINFDDWEILFSEVGEGERKLPGESG